MLSRIAVRHRAGMTVPALFVVAACAALAAVVAPLAVAHDLSANGGCRDGETLVPIPAGSDYPDRNGDLAVCLTPRGSYHDNHVHDGGGGGWTDSGCREGDFFEGVVPGHEADRNGDLAVCRTADGKYYDNRLANDGGSGGGGGWTDSGCREGDFFEGVAPGHEADRNGDLAVCRTADGKYYDNRLH